MSAAGVAWVNTKEAAQILGVTPQRIGQLVADGTLVPVYKSERATIFDRDSVRELVERRKPTQRPNRIARPRPSGGSGRSGTGYVSPMECEFIDEDGER
jgi:hypothetical protein